MNFHRRTSRDRARRNRFVYTLLILLFCIFFFSVFRGTVVSVVSPLWRGQNFVSQGFGNFVGFIKTKNALIEENRLLRTELKKVESLELSVRALEDTQLQILELFGRGTNKDFVAASVLVRPPKTPYDIIVIDAGERDGVQVGDEVSLPEGGALGLVSEVWSTGSRVILYTSTSMETEAYLERGDTPIKLVGRGGGMFVADLPRDTEVEVGDKVLSPKLNSTLIAIVEEVNFDTSDSTKEVLARGVAGVGSLRFVEVYPK